MGFWHTGYMEFHEPAGLDHYHLTPPAPPTYHCSMCGEIFSQLDDLRTHRFNNHPLKRPVLMIRGIEIGDRPLTVSHPLLPSEVQTIHAKSVEVNGRVLRIEELPNFLAARKQDTVKINLRASDTSATFTVRFSIAMQADIEGLEHAFKDIASRGRLDRRSIDDFIRAAEKHPTAITYCDGICHYLHGMLAKERSPESSLPYEEYREKLNRAADSLWDMDRPLARMILSLVGLNFNRLNESSGYAPSTRVGTACRRLLAWLDGEIHSIDACKKASRSPDAALTDLHTEMLIDRILSAPKTVLEHAPELESLILKGFSEYDAMKCRILLTATYFSVGKPRDAKRHARELSHLRIHGVQPDKLLEVAL